MLRCCLVMRNLDMSSNIERCKKPAARTLAAVWLRCSLACDASARDANSLAMWVQRCQPLRSGLEILTIANQQMDGVIPSFASTLSLLALHKNRFKVRQEKKSTKIDFFGLPEIAGRGGGLPRERVVVGKFVPALESLFSLGLQREPGCPGAHGVFKNLCKKVVAHAFGPYQGPL